MEEQEAETDGDSVHQGKTTPKSMAPVTPNFFLPPTVLSTTKLWLKTYPLIRSERPKTQLDHLLLFINTIKLAIRTTLTLPSVAHVTGYQNGPHTPILGLFRVCKGHTCYRLSERLSHTLPFCQLTSGVQSVLALPLSQS